MLCRHICRFVIGREKNPGESEVARLIEQSIAEDKARDDFRQRQQEAARQVCHFFRWDNEKVLNNSLVKAAVYRYLGSSH